MLSKIPLLLLCLLGLGRCSSRAYVVVSVSGLWDQVASLRVDSTLNGMSARQPEDFTGSPQQFTLGLPEGASGPFKVTVEALDGHGCVLASGSNTTVISGTGRVELGVALTRSMGMNCGGTGDLAMVDMDMGQPDSGGCPSYLHAGGGGMNRPEALVPGGQYSVGGVSVPMADFYLDVFLVSVAAYRECVAAGGGGAGGCSKPGISQRCNWSDTPMDKEDHPINCVTWAQANDFCIWAGRRLPAEWEWEYAAAGTRMSTYPWGNDDPKHDPGAQLCWDQYSRDDMSTPLGTCPVGVYEKTLLGDQTCHGVTDQAGNVSEWTSAEYKSTYAYPETPCHITSSLCSIRGGSWNENTAPGFHAAFRDSTAPSYIGNDIGFRCARDP